MNKYEVALEKAKQIFLDADIFTQEKHIEFDELMLSILREEGYMEVAVLFEVMEKWYA